MKLLKLCFFLGFAFTMSCKMSTPISPGELATVHAQLEGTANCTQCHILGKKVSDDKCLTCHTYIDSRIKDKLGYHSSKEVRQKSCVECHSDHHGRNFEIVHFDTLEFDHELTGYLLEDSHAKQACRACHKPEHIVDKELMERAGTFLGLDVSCLNCHDDYHQGTLAKDCNSCHDQKQFSPAAKFDHNTALFTLQGEHSSVDCEKCHPEQNDDNKKFQQFKGLEFASCLSCHSDEHENKFGSDCQSCHSENSFREIKNLDQFNHRLTGYALEGRHKGVDCYECHKESCTAPLAHARCSDCHEDYHKKVFTSRRRSADCKDCHDIQGFDKPKYTLDQHNQSSFPLQGAHMATPCISCHRKGNDWEFRNIGKACVDCHEDVHSSLISLKYYPGQDCQDCHNPSQWAGVLFDHKRTGFDLEGVHALQSCRACHFKGASGTEGQRFSSLDTRCINCHTDVHMGQFNVGGSAECISCHSFSDWQASRFNHDNAKFKLDGKHKDVACMKCHVEKTENNVSFIQYKLNKFRCEDCH